MKKNYKHLSFKISISCLIICFFCILVLGQNVRLRKCKDDDYKCRFSNYSQIVFSKCKNQNNKIDCLINEQTKIIKANPDDVAAYLLRGQTSIIKNKDLAIIDYSKALSIDPNNMQAYLILGSLFIDKKQFEEAINTYNGAIDTDPTNQYAYVGLARTHSKKGDYLTGIQILNNIIELNPKSVTLYEGRGNIYEDNDEFELALADYNKVIEISPKYDDGYVNRANLYLSLKLFDKAIDDYNMAIQLNPRSAWYRYFSRGFAYWKLGEKEKADADCNKAKELGRKKTQKLLGRKESYCN